MRRTATVIVCVALAVGTAIVGRVGADAAPALSRAVVPQRPASTAPRSVMYVGNNWAGTANVIDARTFAKIGRVNVVPDYAERMAEIRSDPQRLAYFLVIREQIGDPQDLRLPFGRIEHLEKGIVVRRSSSHSAIHESPYCVVDGDNLLSNHEAIGKRDRPGVAFDRRVGDEIFCQPDVHGADILDGFPDELRCCVDDEFFVDRCHVCLLSNRMKLLRCISLHLTHAPPPPQSSQSQ